MSIFFDEEGHEDLLKMLVNNEVNLPEVYETVYAAVIKNEDYVLYGQHPKEIKIKAVESLIEYFVKIDEFEKCIVLNKIKNKI